MQIVNKTHYNTADLRRFLSAGMLEYGESLRTMALKVVEICYFAKNPRNYGRAQVGTPEQPARWLMLRLPRDPATLDLHIAAETLEHELAHNRGVKHREMDRSLRWTQQKAFCQWVAEGAFKIAFLPPVPKARPTTADKIEHAKGKLKKAQTRLKRAKTIEAKWTAKLKRLESRAHKDKQPMCSSIAPAVEHSATPQPVPEQGTTATPPNA